MNQESAVEFATASRIHIGLEVQDLQRALAFYTLLFQAEPTKERPGYAKFELEQPPVNLSLSENRRLSSRPKTGAAGMHYGIQVKSSDHVQRTADRLAAAGLETRVEEESACCYAVQTKVWATDPDGHPWEVFVVLDADVNIARSTVSGDEPACCDPTACGC